MRSRYDYMKDGVVKDEDSGNFYPDPLSINYLEFSYNVSNPPKRVKMDDSSITLFWLETSKYMGSPELDDIVLTLNGIPHINLLQYGDYVYFPSRDDIQRSFKRKSIT